MSIINIILLLTPLVFIGCGGDNIDDQKTPTKTHIQKENISNLSTNIDQTEIIQLETKRYIRNQNETVTDIISHLMWQDNNDSNRTKLNWQDAISYCKNLTLGDFDDWRLPEVKELFYLSDKGESDSAFVNLALDIYHTNSTYSQITDSSWYINFNYGFDYIGSKESLHYVRCVRGAKSNINLLKESNNTITDNSTKLIWQDNIAIQTNQKNYEEAKTYCSDLILENYSDWRVPTINELYSITDHNQSNIAINSIFNIRISDNFWSSTPSSSGYAWSINFLQGSNYYHGDEYGWQSKEKKNYIRCVRDKIINSAPIASSQNITLDEDRSKEFQLQVTDDNNNTLTYRITSVPQHGTLSTQMPNITYTPNANYYGSDSFSYVANDGELDSNEAIVNIIINRINDSPISDNISSQYINEDNNLTLTLSASDIDGDNLTYNITSNPTNGTIQLSGNLLQYNPNPNYYGTDHFSFRSSDGIADSNIVDVNITIAPINDNPTTNSIADQNINEDNNLSLTLSASDIDGDNLTYNITSNPTNGTIQLSGNLLQYNPNPNYYGTDHFSFRSNDGIADSNIVDVNITINPVNDYPIFSTINERNITEDDSLVSGIVSASDIDGDTLSFSAPIVSNFSLNSNGNYSYNPMNHQNLENGEQTTITIPITVSDGSLTDQQNLIINVEGINDPPIANAGADIIANEGEIIIFNAMGSHDIDDNITKYEWKEDATILESNNISFVKSDFSVGTHIITLTVTDSYGATSQDIINITINTIVTNNFTPHTVTTNAIYSEWLEMVDLDNDGDIDILSASTGNGGAEISWYKNRGDFTFTESIITTNAQNPESIKASDIDGDGDIDILYTTYESGASLMQCLNDGSQNFTCNPITNATDNLSFIEVVNFDTQNDNLIDIITSSWSNNRVEWLKNSGDGNFTGPHMVDYQNSDEAISTHISDFNKDGKVDIVSAYHGSNRIDWYAYDTQGNGNFEHHFVANINAPYSVDVIDINNDGYDDIMATSNSDGKIYWYKSTQSTSPTFSGALEIATLSNLYYASGVDMDNDGDIDILSNSSQTSGKIAWYENIGGDTNFIEHIVASSVDNVIRVFAVDIDNDKIMDVASGDQAGNIIVYENGTKDFITTLSKTGVPTSTNDGEDGNLQKGIDYNYTRDDINDVVIDNTNNLIWQDNSDINNSPIYWSSAYTQCQNLLLAGYDDWRIPDIHELYYTLNRENSPKTSPIFQNTPVDDGYWVNNFDSSDYSWIDFSNAKGNISNILSAPKKHIRCVRGEPYKVIPIRNDTLDIVVDHIHNLQWQDNEDVIINNRTWDDAIGHCNTLDLNGTNWRLPNINELYSIVDLYKSPTTYRAFKYKTTDSYWSSTNDSGITLIDFSNGIDNQNEPSTNTHKVRCVRDIP